MDRNKNLATCKRLCFSSHRFANRQNGRPGKIEVAESSSKKIKTFYVFSSNKVKGRVRETAL